MGVEGMQLMRKVWQSLWGVLATISVAHASSINMPEGVTPISHAVYHLHMTIFWICVVIGIVVFGAMVYALIFHRKARGHQAAHFHSSRTVEIWWTIIPSLILVGMAVPATLVLMQMSDTAEAELNVKVTGYQWHWQYEYLDQGISFMSNLSTPQSQITGNEPKGPNYLLEVDHELVVPIHRKIRFLVTSNDVIHSWWVPDLGFKRDAIPGFVYEEWARIEKPGVYRGQCAELCGLNHAYMPIVVRAIPEAEFDQWVAAQSQATTRVAAAAATVAAPSAQVASTAAVATTTGAPMTQAAMTQADLMTEGQQVYAARCAVCHQANGEGLPPTFPPLKGGPIVVGPVAAHIQTVLFGHPGTAMAAFKDQLTDQEIAAVVTYERNSFGNADTAKYGKNAGGVVQPAAVTKLKVAQ